VAFPAGKPGILAVFAHPDDETTVSPLLAKYAAAGHPVRLVTITSGQKGTGPFSIK
jgi:LmbE family N-acetylglucosaminyl deacetylase